MSLGSISGRKKTPMADTWNTFSAFIDSTNNQLVIKCGFQDKDGRHRMKGAKADELSLVVDFGTAMAIPGLADLAGQSAEAVSRTIRATRERALHDARQAAKPTTMQPLPKGRARSQNPTPAPVADKPAKGSKTKKSPAKG